MVSSVDVAYNILRLVYTSSTLDTTCPAPDFHSTFPHLLRFLRLPPSSPFPGDTHAASSSSSNVNYYNYDHPPTSDILPSQLVTSYHWGLSLFVVTHVSARVTSSYVSQVSPSGACRLLFFLLFFLV